MAAAVVADAPRQLRLSFDDEPVFEPPSLDELRAHLTDAIAAHEPEMKPPRLRVSGRMTRTLGSFRGRSRTITLSARLLAFGSLEQCRTILLHELAHALVHHREPEAPPHGRDFRAACRELGVSPARVVIVGTEEWASRERYAYDCDRCGDTVLRRRAVRRVRCGCGESFTPHRVARVAIGRHRPPTLIGYVDLSRRSPQAR